MATPQSDDEAICSRTLSLREMGRRLMLPMEILEKWLKNLTGVA
ncbi:MAG: hypothetical protein ACYT04_19510 [Nostoc sp.]